MVTMKLLLNFILCAQLVNGIDNFIPIPRSELMSPMDYSLVTLSLDGKWLAYIGINNGIPNIFVYDLSSGKAKALTNDKGRGITRFNLAYDNKTILYEQDNGGDENFNLYATNVETGVTSIISNTSGVRNEILKTSIKRPNEIIVGNNKRNPAYNDAYIIDLKTGKQELLYENNFFLNLYFDDQLKLRIGSNQTSSASVTFYYFKDNGQIELIRHASPFDQVLTKVIHIGPRGNIYWLDTENFDKANLIFLNPNTNEKEILHVAKKADVTSNVFYHPSNGRPLWLYENYAKPEMILLDLTYESDFKKFQNLTNRSYLEVQMSLDGDKWLLEQISDNKPIAYYLYDKKIDQVQFLFSAKANLSKYKFSTTYPYDVVTSDGLVELCYVNIPPHLDNNGKPLKPLPTVLLVHGGPQARDVWRFNPTYQFYSSREYVLIRCNFRSSTGFGKVFTNAGNGEWGRKMQDDLTDAVKWSIAAKISDPKKIAIVGVSYGGYAVLAGLTFTPELYTCGVAIAAPSNLITAAKMIPEYWKPNLPTLNLQMCNDPSLVCNEEFLRNRSPTFFANRIKVPLVVVQGEKDPRVDKLEAEQIVNALKNTSIPVTYVHFPDEGHWNFRPPNLLATISIMDQFLAKCLGGYAEPITDEIQKSTATIETYNSS